MQKTFCSLCTESFLVFVYYSVFLLKLCSANQLTGFYMMGTLVVNGLNQPEEEDYQFEILEPKLLPLPSKLFLFIINNLLIMNL